MAMLEGLLPQMPSPLTLLGVLLVLFLLYLLSSTPGPRKDPPGPRPLPLLGNLLILDLKWLHLSLYELSKKYGSMFTIYLGSKKVIVLAGYKTIKQALVDHAEEFGARETGAIYCDTFKGHGIVFGNGNSWKEQKRFSISSLRDLGMGKRGGEEKIMTELRHLIEVLESFKGEPFDTTQPVMYSGSNIICRLLYGRCFDNTDPTIKTMISRSQEMSVLFDSTAIRLYNVFPWLRWCCGWWMGNRTQILKNRDEYMEDIKRLVQGMKDTFDPLDLRGFVDSFLVRLQKESDLPGSYFHEDSLRFTVLSLFLGGTVTVTSILRWSLLMMAKYPKVQDQVKEELSRVIGDREPQMEDRKNLPYTDAVIHEILRVADITPMSIPHLTSCDVTFQGYFIKKGTMIIPLLTSMLQDEEEWETPHSFNPGHFLDEKGCFIKRDAFMPFSAGRRACMGQSLTRMEIFLFFTFLLQRFRFTPPPGVSEDELDLTPTMMGVLVPSPHQLCAVSRA